MISFPGFEEIVSQQELDVFDNGRYEEIVQMLSDLGYLVISAEEGKIIDSEMLREAVFNFRKETIAGSLNSRNSMQLPFPENPRENHEGILTYREFSVLQLLVSLDGDFTLKPVSEIKNFGIYTRVLQYRLHLLGLLDSPPDGQFSDKLIQALGILSGWISPSEPRELLELTGNIRRLIFRIRGSQVFANKIVYFRFGAGNSQLYSIRGNNEDFIEQLRRNIDRKSSDFKELKEKSKTKNFSKEFFEDRCNDEEGKFLVRLLQLHQWVSGYYLGTIDGELGDLTFSSFIELAQGETESGNTDFKMNLLVGFVADKYWVVNPHYILGEFTYRTDEYAPSGSDVFSSFDQEYEKLDSTEKQTVDENIRSTWKSMNVGFSGDLKSSANRFRRIYFGAKSLLKSFWQGMKNIFKKLKEKIVDLVSNLFNLVKNFVKYMYREIRESLHIFSRGLKFLFGKRLLETDDCFTKFDFDLDSISAIKGPLTATTLKTHQQLLIETTTGLTFCLALTGQIIHVVLLLTLSWPKLILEAGVLLKKLVKESYAKKDYAGFIVDPQG